MSVYIVTKGFKFDCFDGKEKRFVTGDLIDYRRYNKQGILALHIKMNDDNYKGINFDIENYVEKIVPNKKHIQIQRLDSVVNANKFLMTISKDDVVDIKPMENNTYLVIYASEDKNDKLERNA